MVMTVSEESTDLVRQIRRLHLVFGAAFTAIGVWVLGYFFIVGETAPLWAEVLVVACGAISLLLGLVMLRYPVSFAAAMLTTEVTPIDERR